MTRILFLHVPKCGGTSIDIAFRRSHGFYRRLTGRGMATFNASQSRRAAEKLGQGLSQMREVLLAYYLEDPSLVYLSGHFAFSNRLLSSNPSWEIVTLLREPVARWLSHYFYNRFKPDRAHYGIDSPLEEFVGTPAAENYGCLLVRSFMGSDFDASPRSREAIDRAKTNIEKVAVVGLLDRLDVFIDEVDSRYGLKLNIPHARANRHKGYDKNQVTSQLKEKIRELCAPDSELYEFARSRVRTRH